MLPSMEGKKKKLNPCKIGSKTEQVRPIAENIVCFSGQLFLHTVYFYFTLFFVFSYFRRLKYLYHYITWWDKFVYLKKLKKYEKQVQINA